MTRWRTSFSLTATGCCVRRARSAARTRRQRAADSSSSPRLRSQAVSSTSCARCAPRARLRVQPGMACCGSAPARGVGGATRLRRWRRRCAPLPFVHRSCSPACGRSCVAACSARGLDPVRSAAIDTNAHTPRSAAHRFTCAALSTRCLFTSHATPPACTPSRSCSASCGATRRCSTRHGRTTPAGCGARSRTPRSGWLTRYAVSDIASPRRHAAAPAEAQEGA